jgi:hypothetical protein
MRRLLLGASVLALLAPAVHAQPAGQGMGGAVAQQVEQDRFLVFFDFDSAALRADARQVIADAASRYRETGAAEISLVGHADLSGSDAYNQQLSERRAVAVRDELVRQGVPAGVIDTFAQGERDPLVETAEGVPEDRNRRVSIELPAAPPPEPVVAEPIPPPEEPPAPTRWQFAIGPFYGLNLDEEDEGDETYSHLGGVELRLGYELTPNLVASIEQAGFYAFEAQDDGIGGRSVASLDFMGDWGGVQPYLGINAGGVYGKGVRDGVVVGPELGVNFGITERSFYYARVAYDYQLRNEGWDEGIVNASTGIGFRF